jgi:D-serine deaminase-like pyridoxal phosphate-dependent protein
MNETSIDSLPTPCLLLDAGRFERNVHSMRERIEQRGARLRLHAKTNKSIDVTRRVIGGGDGGSIMVSTLHEARYFHEHGISDITYGVGIVPAKFGDVAELIRRGVNLQVVLDDAAVARQLAQRGRELDVEFRAYIEVDTDGHRAGVQPDDAELINIGRILQDESGVALAGVLTHAGSSYDCRSIDAIRAMAEQERRLIVQAAQALRAAGIDCKEVSLGSTPTATYGESLAGVTEVRAGVYVFQDLVMAGIGVCRVEDIALSVLTTVIGVQRARNRVIVDAGWMSLSRDRGTANQPIDQGYGLVCDIDGQAYGDLILVAANQEQGIVADRHGRAIDFQQLQIGARLRILPNHACATGAQHDSYRVVRDRQVSAVWPRINHW